MLAMIYVYGRLNIGVSTWHWENACLTHITIAVRNSDYIYSDNRLRNGGVGYETKVIEGELYRLRILSTQYFRLHINQTIAKIRNTQPTTTVTV